MFVLNRPIMRYNDVLDRPLLYFLLQPSSGLRHYNNNNNNNNMLKV